MNAQIFLENFGYIANAPNGIKRLREMIYYLGVTGALCQQNPEEGDGLSLFEIIDKEKQTRIEQRLFKHSPKLENSKDTFNEFLPEIPDTWAWTRLVDIGEISPKNGAEDDEMASFASMRTISEKHAVPSQPEDRLWGTIKKGYTHFANGDVVVAKITPCFENGKAAVIRALTSGIGAGTTELHVVRPLPGVDPGFIYIFLRSPYFRMIGEGYMTGTAGQKRLPTDYFATRPLPLPPTLEQERIVAKVDELMALCDKLEALQQERERRFPILSLTCHARFAESPTPAHLKAIFDETETVSPNDLRGTILNLAFKGLLLSQDTEDEPASILLERARSRKNVLIERGIIKKEPWSNKLADASHLYSLPPCWIWTRVTDVVEKVTVGFVGSMKKHYRDQGIPFLRSQNVRENRYEPTGLVYISEEFHRSISKSALEPSDVVVTRSGNVGVTCVVPEVLQSANCSDLVIIKRPIAVLPRYLSYFINSVASQQIAANTVGIALTHFNTKSVAQMTIALPPLTEQHRIVAKVDQLMAFVDQLEEQQNKKNKVAEDFAQAAVAAITGTQIKELKNMKAPKTELVTKLQTRSKPKATDEAPLAKLIGKHKGELAARALWQQSGLEIDIFYQQLKIEMAQGWIVEPEKAVMKEVEAS